MSNPLRASRPTQRTIAERAEISVGAVSRALANDPKIAKDTRDLVQRIAKEIGYTPDRAAQRLRTGRTHVISLILPPHGEILDFGASLIRGISACLENTPYHLVVTPDFDIDQPDAAIRRVVRDNLADGIIFSRTSPDDKRVRFLLEAGFPFVSHGRTELATPHAFVDYDNFEFARIAAERLVKRGAKRLAILLPPRKFTFHHHLQHGFMTAIRETGVHHEILDTATLDSTPDEIKLAVENRFKGSNPPDGLILPGEVSGLAALAAVQDAGLIPGKDVHLIVKQTTGLFGLIRPRIESLFEDLPTAGQKMASMLIRQIGGEPAHALNYIQPVPTSSEE